VRRTVSHAGRTHVSGCGRANHGFSRSVEHALKALSLVNDLNREFITSAYLKLELLPQATWHRRQSEIEFYETYFAHAHHYISATEELTQDALREAGANVLEAMDALHVAAARKASADVFVTIEKPQKPLYRIRELQVVHLSSFSAVV
jgi:predicted nucleic acid-binding protein